MINIIVAMAKNRVIGKNNELLWHIPEDLKRFKRLTIGHAVIMGRKTFESVLKRLGKPLPERLNIVLTRDASYQREGCQVAQSIEKALELASGKEVFIIGGAEVYAQALPKAERLYVTLIEHEYEGDVSFPQISAEEWKVIAREDGNDPTFSYPYAFLTYERV